MSMINQSSISVVGIGVCISAVIVSLTFAAESVPTAPTKEMRQQMAQAHEKLAACLRSDREFSECRQEMMQTCSARFASYGCGMMMGQGMQMRNQMRSGGKQQSSASK